MAKCVSHYLTSTLAKIVIRNNQGTEEEVYGIQEKIITKITGYSIGCHTV